MSEPANNRQRIVGNPLGLTREQLVQSETERAFGQMAGTWDGKIIMRDEKVCAMIAGTPVEMPASLAALFEDLDPKGEKPE